MKFRWIFCISLAVFLGLSTFVGSQTGWWGHYSNIVYTPHNLQTGVNSRDGKLIIFSEQGNTDYKASISPHSAMTSNMDWYLPADEPTATSLLNITSAGQIGYDSSTYLTGPSSSTDNAVARWDGTGGSTLQDSTTTVADNGDLQVSDGSNTLDLRRTGSSSYEIESSGWLVLEPGAANGTQINKSSGTSGVYFYDGSNNVVARMTGSGYWGVGTDSPDSLLQVYGQMKVGDDDHTGQMLINFQQDDNLSSGWNVGYAGGASNIFYIYGYENADLKFYTNAAHRMTVASGGNVGIGTDSPNTLLDVRSDQSSTYGIKSLCFGDNAFGARVVFDKTRNASGESHTIVQNNDQMMVLDARGSNGSAYKNLASVRAYVDGTPGAGDDMPGRLSFWTTPDGAGTPSIRMTIKNDGNIGIGETSPDTQLHIKSSSSYSPNITLEGTYDTDGAGGPTLKFDRNQATAADGDEIARIMMEGRTSTTPDEVFVAVRGYSERVLDAERSGKLDFTVLMNDGWKSLLQLDGYTSTAGQGDIRLNAADEEVTTSIEDVDGIAFKVQGDGSGIELEKRVVWNHDTITADSDSFDVSDINVLFVDTSGGGITLGGLSNGKVGQPLKIVITDSTNSIKIEHNEASGTQKFFLRYGSDYTISTYGGWNFVCNGTHWYDAVPQY